MQLLKLATTLFSQTKPDGFTRIKKFSFVESLLNIDSKIKFTMILEFLFLNNCTWDERSSLCFKLNKNTSHWEKMAVFISRSSIIIEKILFFFFSSERIDWRLIHKFCEVDSKSFCFIGHDNEKLCVKQVLH